MPSFSVNPLFDVPPPQAQEFPNFIQFQQSGANLGGPDADVLNFSGGLTATRGTGENSGVVTVSGGGGGGGGPARTAFRLFTGDGTFDFDGQPFNNWAGEVIAGSADWELFALAPFLPRQIKFLAAGNYILTITASFTSLFGPDGHWSYGTAIGDESRNILTLSRHGRYRQDGDETDNQNTRTWTDQHLVTAIDQEVFSLGLYVEAAVTTSQGGSAGMLVVVDRLGG